MRIRVTGSRRLFACYADKALAANSDTTLGYRGMRLSDTMSLALFSNMISRFASQIATLTYCFLSLLLPSRIPIRSALLPNTGERSRIKGPNFTLFMCQPTAPDAAGLFRDLARTGSRLRPNRTLGWSIGSFRVAHLQMRGIIIQGIRRGASRPHSSRDPRFQMNLAIPTPFDWTAGDTLESTR